MTATISDTQTQDIAAYMRGVGQPPRAASRKVAVAEPGAKNAALLELAARLLDRRARSKSAHATGLTDAR